MSIRWRNRAGGRTNTPRRFAPPLSRGEPDFGEGGQWQSFSSSAIQSFSLPLHSLALAATSDLGSLALAATNWTGNEWRGMGSHRQNCTIVAAARSHLSARYQNEAVYRSAERLIASQARPRTRAIGSRVLWFAAGAACALALALAWSHLSKPQSEGLGAGMIADGSAKRARAKPHYLTWKPGGTRSPNADADAQHASRPATESAGVSAIPDSREANPNAPARTQERQAMGSETSAARTSTVSASTTILTSVTTRVHLRGDMRRSNGATRAIEFELQLRPGRLGGSISGVATLSETSHTGATLRVAGTWVNRTFTLREVDAKGRELPGPVTTFVVEFPDAGQTGELTGYWSRGAGESGALTLRPIVVF